MYTKIKITGVIKLETGLHIGGSRAFAAIGAVDSPIVRDTLSGKPMIPGSSLKGKMRTLLSRSKNILSTKPEDDGNEICRVFGSQTQKSRLLFSDSILSNEKELKDLGVQSITEVKFENTINRASGIANPRQIERTIRGSKFPLILMYEINDGTKKEEILEDMRLIANGLTLLEYDYLGGSGSRGYGKVKFEEIQLQNVIGDLESAVLEQCRGMFI